MRKVLAAIVLMFLAALNVSAANHYIRAGATGGNTGADWTNAWPSLSSVFWTRGDVYYIANGSYGNFTFTTGDSGTSTIELRGAIDQGDHGTSVGWSSSYQGQALLGGGGSAIRSDYWIINGQAVPGCSYPSSTETCFTIKFQNPAVGGVGGSPASGQAIYLCTGSSFCTNYTLEYVDVLGSNFTDISGNYTDEGIYCYEQCSQVSLLYDYIHDVGCDTLSFNAFAGDLITIDHSWIARNDVGLGNISGSYAHCQGIQSTVQTMHISNNVWQDMQSSGAITMAAGGNGGQIVEWDVTGNIFFWDAAWNATWSGNGSVGYDDGIVGIFDETQGYMGGPLRIYNNTIYGAGLAATQNCNMQAYTINSGETVVATIYNNIWSDFENQCNAGSAGAGTYDYNAYYKINNGTNDSGTHSYSSGSEPFVNPTNNTVAGFQLVTDTHNGLSQSSPYNVDMLGVTRGVNGTWDFGALQLGGMVTTYMVMVQTPAVGGIHITASPADNNSIASGNSPFVLTYNSGIVVTLTAPIKAGDQIYFAGWKNCDSVTANQCSITVNANRTPQVIYVNDEDVSVN